MNRSSWAVIAVLALSIPATAGASYVNFEVSHVHPLDLTPSGDRLLAVNTPDALLEVFAVQPDGSLAPEASIPVGLEPVTVLARNDGEAWVVNNLSDSISIVDLELGVTTATIVVGDEPTDVVFAGGKAFVSVSSEDKVRVYDASNPSAGTIAEVALSGRDVRALAVSADGQKVYAVVLRSGNQTTVLGVHATFGTGLGFDAARLAAMGLRDLECDGPTPSYPPLPPGVTRNPALVDPPNGIPPVGLIVSWDDAAGEWQDETGADWSGCLPYRPADNDLFVIDVADPASTPLPVKHLGTSLFEVSVHPGGKIYVPHTEARNFVRFEHPLGVEGHMVDNRLAVVDPANGNSVTTIDLNTHIDRGSDPATNIAERLASVSQPGMMVWKSDGSVGYLTAIGSRKVFRVDGACLAGSCIFGASRPSPDATEVGEGPTGVALLEATQPGDERLYVLNRISHSVAIVRTQDLQLLEEIPLHDPSSDATKEGRRFLYDAIDSSGHGDAACASCHLSGDMDGLAWDLGNPAGDFTPYTTPMDNVRFVVPFGGGPVGCDPSVCASHDGFDPQKGPMTTQSLRGMLEPLHWRGDRPTMNDFNSAFVGLMGTEDIGPVNGKPAGLSAAEMEKFRQFALEVHYPPNPFRNVDDTMPCGIRAQDPACEVSMHGALFAGNPTEGERIFDNEPSDANQPCAACHTHPFGAGGGKLFGVEPTEPTSGDAAALFNGDADGSPHSDLKIPHTRNMYEKFGPVLADPGDASMPETANGFGYVHDGGIPDLYRFLSAGVFTLSPADQAQEVRDLAAFMFHFPTATRPAVGRQVTLPAGTPPTGPAGDEQLLSDLVSLGDAVNPARHCELVASTVAGGVLRHYRLSAVSWIPDAAADPPLTTTALREAASAAITFTCATLGSGPRLGGDRDLDLALDFDDCAPGDADTFGEAATVSGFSVAPGVVTTLSWDDQASATGPSLRYDVLGGDVSTLAGSGIAAAGCVAGGLAVSAYPDSRPDPPAGEGYYYLIRASNPCGVADLGPGRESLESLVCS